MNTAGELRDYLGQFSADTPIKVKNKDGFYQNMIHPFPAMETEDGLAGFGHIPIQESQCLLLSSD